MPDHVGPWPLDGVRTTSWLLRFDKEGDCNSPQTKRQLIQFLQRGETDHIIFFSHGWNNDFQFAGDLYSHFMQHLEPMVPGDAIGRFAFVGVTWPSTWHPDVVGPVIAAIEDRSSADMIEQAARSAASDVPDASQRKRLTDLLMSRRLSNEQALEAASIAVTGLRGARGKPDGGDLGAGSEDATRPEREDLLAAAKALSTADGSFDTDFGTVDAPARERVSAAGETFLDPADLIRVLTVYQMKDRAGVVGSAGVHDLLGEMLGSCNSAIHLVGHSYGCKVMLSATCTGALPRLASSLLLLEPAVNYLCFANEVPGTTAPGAYRSALQRIEQPTLSTYSAHDVPLHDIFHLALRRRGDLGELGFAAGATSAGEPPSLYAALGGYGPRLADEELVDPIPASGEHYNIPAGIRLVGLDGTRERRIDGHGDVTTDFTAWALRSQLGNL